MKLTVLGANATYPTPDSAASAYVVQSPDGGAVLVDAGPGSVRELLRVIDINQLEGVVVSHAHADHCADVAALYFRLRHGPEPKRRIPLIAPTGVFERLSDFVTYQSNGGGFEETFDRRVVGDGDATRLIGFKWSFRRTDHPVPCIATRIDDPGKSITYTSDTGPDIDLRPLTEGTTVLIAEATFQGEDTAGTQHLTASWAGRLAADSSAGRLILTHIAPHLDPAVSIGEASRFFAGSVEAARPGMVVEL